MKTPLARLLALLVITLLLISAPPDWATCGGGGGGGGGGMASAGPSGGGGTAPDQVYNVPWKVRGDQEPLTGTGLMLVWFPSSNDELKKSSLRVSRTLALYAQQCVAMEVASTQSVVGAKLAVDTKLPVAVLATPDGTAIVKVENKDGFLKVDQVEKAVESEMKKRETAVNEQMKDAKDKAKSGDNDGAITIYKAVLDQKCLFPGKAKDAAKELKKLGVKDVAEVADGPIFDHARSKQIEHTMWRGYKAELDSNYLEAEKIYIEASKMDPADATPLRYLGELYRHEIGDWVKARAVFEQILAMPADPLSIAVAQHGLGKMTIHEGDFAKGLGLMETSVETYPTALAYRNLSVYWNSEGNQKKADFYLQKALALDPQDPYNLVFAAAFMAGTGHGEEALKIAKANENLLPASYNLAAVYAQTGQKGKALALLKRHFFEYERYQAVRSKEMMEARVDAVFLSIRSDPTFVALTKDSDGKLDPSRTMSSRP
ncbi:MAG TPA: tetratricopeptide repeat protein [Candidatus Acidoferrales bacterium]|nr:tetratricopeptide repeat protein [Candidatus Acidoferrales bacterium]